jgi:hypothetical protein
LIASQLQHLTTLGLSLPVGSSSHPLVDIRVLSTLKNLRQVCVCVWEVKGGGEGMWGGCGSVNGSSRQLFNIRAHNTLQYN